MPCNKVIKSIVLIFLVFNLKVLAQKKENTSNQDTVFIKHTNDWSSDTLKYTTDTVIFESGMMRHILTGTTILPSTYNQEVTKGYGLFFNKNTKSNCQTELGLEEKISPDKITSIQTTDTTLIVEININTNCCYSFLCDVSVENDSILNLIYIGYGTYCFCDCCYGLTYSFSKEKWFDKKKIHSIMIKNEPKTIKHIK